MKAYPVVWKYTDKYKVRIILISTFYLTSPYLKILGKRMAGSGPSDILSESGLISPGSINGVITGKITTEH